MKPYQVNSYSYVPMCESRFVKNADPLDVPPHIILRRLINGRSSTGNYLTHSANDNTK